MENPQINGLYTTILDLEESTKEILENSKNTKIEIQALNKHIETFIKLYKTSIPIQMVFYIFAIVFLLIAGIQGVTAFFSHFK